MALDYKKNSEEFVYEAVKLLAELLRRYAVILEINRNEFEVTSRGVTARITTTRRVLAPHSEVRVSQIWAFFRGAPLTSLPSFVARLFRAPRALGYVVERAIVAMRHIAGIGSNVIRHPLGNAARTPSYHLELKGSRPHVHGEAGHRTPGAKRSGTSGLRDLDALGRTAPLAPLHPQRAAVFQEYAVQRHVFRTQPGSLAIAFIAAASSLVVSSVLAIRQLQAIEVATGNEIEVNEQSALENGTKFDPSAIDHWQIAASLPDQSGLLQILLSFPIVVIVASTVIRSRDPWGGVLSARISNLITVLLSLAALWVSSLPATPSPIWHCLAYGSSCSAGWRSSPLVASGHG